MANTPVRAYAGRPAHERRLERRAKLVDAALTVFSTTGYLASSVAEICAMSSLSTRQFYAEFASREAVLGAAYELVNENAQAAVTRAALGSADMALESRLPFLIGAYITEVTADVRHARIAFVEVIGVSDELEERRQQRIQSWIELLDSLVAGDIAAGELPARDYRLAWIGFIGAVNALIYHRTTKSPETPVRALVEELERLARTGILK